MLSLEEDEETTVNDFSFIYIIGLLAILALMVIEKKSTEIPVPKNTLYQVIMTWDGNSENDVDLWAKDPKGRITGFKRREGGAGSLFAISHDDLGHKNDLKDGEPILDNREVINIRGVFEGEYAVTCHMYADRDKKGSCKVTAELIRMKDGTSIIKNTVDLKQEGDELTFFRFVFDDKEKVIDTNDLPAQVAIKENTP